jgi:hypothetical protein
VTAGYFALAAVALAFPRATALVGIVVILRIAWRWAWR